MDAAGFLTNEAWLEEHLRAAEAPASNSDGVPIWEYVGLLIAGTFACLLSHCVEVPGGVGQLHLDVTHDLTLGSGRETSHPRQRTTEIDFARQNLLEIPIGSSSQKGCRPTIHS